MICSDKIMMMNGVTFHASQTRERAQSDAPQVRVSGQSDCSDACGEVDQKNGEKKEENDLFFQQP